MTYSSLHAVLLLLACTSPITATRLGVEPASVAAPLAPLEPTNDAEDAPAPAPIQQRRGITGCIADCSGHGSCVSQGFDKVCLCRPGFAGESCEVSFCDSLKNCNGHGVCHQPGIDSPMNDGANARHLKFFAHALEISEEPRNSPLWQQFHGHQRTRWGPNDIGCECFEGWMGMTCLERACDPPCVQGRGSCHEGTCICESGFAGVQCELETCKEDCMKNGECKDGKCECKDGFTGLYCGTGPEGCPNFDGKTCGGNGLCRDKHCFCTGLFMAPDCRFVACIDNCFEHGICVNGKCQCDEKYSGEKCELHAEKQCFDGTDGGPNGCPYCAGHGSCALGTLGAPRCTCDNGWGGFGCQELKCPRACSKHGECKEDGTCACEKGFTGDGCQYMECPGDCSGHGECVKGYCRCDYLWGGEGCDFRLCPGVNSQCSGHGHCRQGVCECQTGFSGDDCSEPTCPSTLADLECSGHGHCESEGEGESFCVCGPAYPPPFEGTTLYTGEDCSRRQCPVADCSGHGKCTKGVCDCEHEWAGVGCHNKDYFCENHLGCNYPHGICDNGRCWCKSGQSLGPDCSEMRKVTNDMMTEAHQMYLAEKERNSMGATGASGGEGDSSGSGSSLLELAPELF